MRKAFMLNSILALFATLSLSSSFALAVDPDEELARQQERRGRRADDPSRWPEPPVATAAKADRKSPIQVNDPMDGRRLGGPKPPSRTAPAPSTTNSCLPEIRKAKETLAREWKVSPEDLSPSRYDAFLREEKAEAERHVAEVRLAAKTIVPSQRAYWHALLREPNNLTLQATLRESLQSSLRKVISFPENGIVISPRYRLAMIGNGDVGLDELFALPDNEIEAKISSRYHARARARAFDRFMKPSEGATRHGYSDADEYFREVVTGKLGLRAACFPEWEAHRTAERALDAATTAMDRALFEMKGPQGTVSKETAERVKQTTDQAIDASGEAARRAAEREWTSAGMANP